MIFDGVIIGKWVICLEGDKRDGVMDEHKEPTASRVIRTIKSDGSIVGERVKCC